MRMMMCALIIGLVGVACGSPPPDPPGIYDGHVSGDFFEMQVDNDADVLNDESIGWDAVHGYMSASSMLTIRTNDEHAVVLATFANKTLNDVEPGLYQYRTNPRELPNEDFMVWTCQPTPSPDDDDDVMLNDAKPQSLDLNVIETDNGKIFELHTELQSGSSIAETNTTWRYVPKGLMDQEEPDAT